jgi:hypothetical protein
LGKYLFWSGKREDSMLGNAPSINIEAAKDDNKKMMPNAQTLISLWY